MSLLARLAVFVGVIAAVALAVPAPPCVFGSPQGFTLEPTGAVTDNGLIVENIGTRRYRLDSGVEFSVDVGTVLADALPSSRCSQLATSVTLNTSSPFADDAGTQVFILRAVNP
ncbi:MAG: hypothetical protein QM817_28335 [Archangium sp.]